MSRSAKTRKLDPTPDAIAPQTTAVSAPSAPLSVERPQVVRPKPMRFVHLHAPFNRIMTAAPQDVHATPSMMSDQEIDFLYSIAKKYYRGVGVIVDAGIFLGGSTAAFSFGLRENQFLRAAEQRWSRPILSFERAIVSSTMPAFFQRHGIGLNLRPGDSFEGLLRHYVASHLDLVDLRIGDVMSQGVVEEKIEVLFLDVLKMAPIANFAVEQYFPRLIPRRSILIQQDYFFEGLPFIKVLQEYFGEYFDYIGEVGSSAVFRCVERIPRASINRFLKGVPVDRQLELMAVAMQRSIDPMRRLMMGLSKARLLKDAQGAEIAQTYLSHLESDFAGQLIGVPLPRIANALQETRNYCLGDI